MSDEPKQQAPKPATDHYRTPLSAPTRELHEALLRHLKGLLTAYERWLSQQ